MIISTNTGENTKQRLSYNSKVEGFSALASTNKLASTSASSLNLETEVKCEKVEQDDDMISDCADDREIIIDGTEGQCENIAINSVESGINAVTVVCPLCQEFFSDKRTLERHVITIHSVNSDGLARLLNLVDTNLWLNSKKSPQSADCKSDNGDIECSTCQNGFKTMPELLQHANENQHYSMSNDLYMCILRTCHQCFPSVLNMNTHFRDFHMNIVISEKHVYKYRCKLCSLAFKTQEKLNTHALYHTMRDATKCNICNRNFRSAASLQKHIDQVHGLNSPITSPDGLDKSDVDDYITSPTTSIKQEDNDLDSRDEEICQFSSEISDLDDYLNSHAMAEDTYNDQMRKHKCHKCKMAFTQSIFLVQHYKSNVHRRNEKINNYSVEKYLDPNRPFKCEICRESFTQKNILLVHYNSVSHLHKLKKQSENNNTPSSSPSNDLDHKNVDFDRRSSIDIDRKSVELDRKNFDFEHKSIDFECESESQKRKFYSENDYDSPKKRFKCDICKVAYAQGSTLDIHMRSVLHQTRACRLQEQNLSIPILQPQQQQPLIVSAISTTQLQPKLQNLGLTLSPTTINKTLPEVSQPTTSGSSNTQLTSSSSPTPSNQSGAQDINETNSPKISNQIYKTLLENFGFDIVKQFNEINKYSYNNNGNTAQLSVPVSSTITASNEDDVPVSAEDITSASASHHQHQITSTNSVSNISNDITTSGSNTANVGTIMGEEKYYCRHCKKIFSSIFVLKSHCEEIHNEKIPLEFLEKFAEKFKNYYLDIGENENQILDFSSKKDIISKDLVGIVKTNKESVSPSFLPQQLQTDEYHQLQQQAAQQPHKNISPLPDLTQKLNSEIAQKVVEQNAPSLPQSFPNIPPNLQNLQNMQNLHNIQNLPNMGNLQMNTLDMLNLMQFHHLMSLNFMNLAPPLIFGGGAVGGTNTPSLAQTTGNSGAQTNLSGTASNVGGSTTDLSNTTGVQQVQILQQQAAAAAQAAAVQQVC